MPGEPVPGWVRWLLAGMALAFAAVFVLALRIDPYRDGPQTAGTHRQLGLPPCSFLEVTGRPCPSCGLSTSFSYTVRGDLAGGARANWVGVLMAVLALLAIPWGIASAALGRALFLRSLERSVVAVVIAVFVLLFVRWGIVLAWP
ncbi:MAG: DUF2752 domain-containing protein [Gemmataceae bacterium]|nr:DUF2752 domain-containing protein [Gemmataceae bacterium]